MNILQKSSTRKSSDNNQKHGRQAPVLLCVLLLLLFVAILVSVGFGSVRISLLEGLRALLSGDTESPAFRVLWYLRLPRVFAGALAGAALAVSGVLIQAVLQNPMAAPNVIGVNSGAGLGAVLTLTVFPGAVSLLPLAAFCGAVLACLCIYAISVRTGGERMTVILVGIAVSSILNGGINAIKMLYPDSVYDADSFMIGGLSGVTYARIAPAAILIAIGILCSMLVSRGADILSLGKDSAKVLGMNVTGFQLLLLVLASVLAGAAVSFAGLLGFVGLVVPHIARKLVGAAHRWVLPVSALGGALLVLICDLLCRVLFAPYELPVGILLSFVGGPFFITLVLTGRKRHD